LVRLKLLLEERMTGSLVRLDLNRVEEKNSPQFGSPKFPLQLISRGKVPMKKNLLKNKMVKILPVDGALAESVMTNGC
jgi:hypothetical protein